MNPTTTRLDDRRTRFVPRASVTRIYEWSAQTAVDPIPVARDRGRLLLDPEGKRYLDFNSQLDVRQHRAFAPQRRARDPGPGGAALLCNPFMATEPRAARAKLAEVTPGDIDTFFFTNGGATPTSRIRVARIVTGRHKSWRATVRTTGGRRAPSR